MGTANPILYLGNYFINSFEQLVDLLKQLETQSNSVAEGLRDDLLSATRDGIMYEWLTLYAPTLAMQFSPHEFQDLTDSELFSKICGSLKIKITSTTLKVTDYIELNQDIKLIYKDGDDGHFKITSDVISIPRSTKEIQLGLNIKRTAKEVASLEIFAQKSDGELIKVNELQISLLDNKSVNVSINLESLEYEYIIIKANNFALLTFMRENMLFIDMGTSVLWCDRDLGAETVNDPGERYRWGELHPFSLTRYNVPDDIVFISGDEKYDAVTAKFGKGYSIPTEEEFMELISISKVSVEYNNKGRKSIVLTSKITGNRLLLTGGKRTAYGMEIHDYYYWTGNSYGNTYTCDDYAITINVGSLDGIRPMRGTSMGRGGGGFPIRPVCKRSLK